MPTSSNDISFSHSVELPREFVENVLGVCGPGGEAWLRDLPRLIGELEYKWNINVRPHFNNLSYNFVAPAVTADGSNVVLKLGFPAGYDEYSSEADCLRYLNGDGAVKLIDEDREVRALLLDRAIPGSDLRLAFGHVHYKAVDAAIGVLKRFVRKPPIGGSFIPLGEWTGKLLEPQNEEFPINYTERALDIFGRTNGSNEYLIHGDFHHENILSHGADSILVIDPKGVIGDLRYDIAVFLNNHRAWLRNEPDLRPTLDRAVRKFAGAFGFSARSVREWAFAQKVLGAYWTSTEGRSRWREQLASADIWDV